MPLRLFGLLQLFTYLPPLLLVIYLVYLGQISTWVSNFMFLEGKKLNKVYKTEISIISKNIKSILKKEKLGDFYLPAMYVLFGGKFLRPLLVVLSSKVICRSNIKNIYGVASSFELLHAASIVQDDIMDDEEKRRGKLTAYKKYGVGEALLLSDVLLSLSFKNIFVCSCDKKVTNLIFRCVINMCNGQRADINSGKDKLLSFPDYKKNIYKKTAIFTETGCAVGAVLSNATKKEIKALSDYGKFFGIAFQMKDDLLDAMLPQDLFNGKESYIFLRAIEKSGNRDKKWLLGLVKKKVYSSGDLIKYKNLLVKLGIVESLELEIKKYIKKSIEALRVFDDSDYKKIMISISHSVLSR